MSRCRGKNAEIQTSKQQDKAGKNINKPACWCGGSVLAMAQESWVQIPWLDWPPTESQLPPSECRPLWPQQRGRSETVWMSPRWQQEPLCALSLWLHVWGRVCDLPEISASIQWFKWPSSISCLRIPLQMFLPLLWPSSLLSTDPSLKACDSGQGWEERLSEGKESLRVIALGALRDICSTSLS